MFPNLTGNSVAETGTSVAVRHNAKQNSAPVKGIHPMAKLTKTKMFEATVAAKETPMDKTSRVAKSMIEKDAEQRKTKMERLRKSRLEREASTPARTKAAGKSKALKK